MASDTQKDSNQMWGGRFQQSPDALMEAINVSIDFDKRFFRQDIRASKAHAQMLANQNIIAKDDAEKIIAGLDKIGAQIESGDFTFSRQLEDIHMNVEAALKDDIGEAAGRLHTARSRNDQVATDMRLYMRDMLDQLMGQITHLQKVLVEKAALYPSLVMPGFTHLQTAQPVTFGHHLLAYVEMLARDKGRLNDARTRLNENPLGSAALAGTPFPIDRQATSNALEFDRPTANSLDAVSDRDFILETLSALSIMAMHLSRFAEELVIWSSAQFNFIRLSDKFSTGSSIMPQKRNPDAAELIRAKIGRILGAQNALMVTMKGLPLAYSKDMQEDKELTFDALDTADLILAAMTGMVEDMHPVENNMREAAGHGFSTATDLADWLVRVLNIPFREAHHITGEIVAHAERNQIQLADIPLETMKSIKAEITDDVYSVLTIDASVASRVSYGGTAPENIKGQVERWQKILADNPESK